MITQRLELVKLTRDGNASETVRFGAAVELGRVQGEGAGGGEDEEEAGVECKAGSGEGVDALGFGGDAEADDGGEFGNGFDLLEEEIGASGDGVSGFEGGLGCELEAVQETVVGAGEEKVAYPDTHSNAHDTVHNSLRDVHKVASSGRDH